VSEILEWAKRERAKTEEGPRSVLHGWMRHEAIAIFDALIAREDALLVLRPWIKVIDSRLMLRHVDGALAVDPRPKT